MQNNPLIDRLGRALRRVALIAGAVLLLAVTTLLLVFPVDIGDALDGVNPIVRVGVIVLVDAALLWLIYMQIRPFPRASKDGLMVRRADAITDVSVESARERVLSVISAVPDVVAVDARVQAVRGRAFIELDVAVDNRITDLPGKQREIDRALKQVIHKQLGLLMADRPRVHVELKSKDAPKPAAPAPVVPPPAVESKPEPEKARTGLFGSADRKSEEQTDLRAPEVPKTPAHHEDEGQHKGLGIFRRHRPEEEVVKEPEDNAVNVEAARSAVDSGAADTAVDDADGVDAIDFAQLWAQSRPSQSPPDMQKDAPPAAEDTPAPDTDAADADKTDTPKPPFS